MHTNNHFYFHVEQLVEHRKRTNKINIIIFFIIIRFPASERKNFFMLLLPLMMMIPCDCWCAHRRVKSGRKRRWFDINPVSTVTPVCRQSSSVGQEIACMQGVGAARLIISIRLARREKQI